MCVGGGGGGGGGEASCLVAKQAVEFPQVLAINILNYFQSSELHSQIARLLRQLETGEGERQELEAEYLLTQQHNQQTLSEKEAKWARLLTSYQSNSISIYASFRISQPVSGKFMVYAVGQFILQPMARTNHKFPATGGRGIQYRSLHNPCNTETH